MKIKNSRDAENFLELISLPTVQVNDEKMATDNMVSLFIRESQRWKNKKILPHICQKASLTHIAQSIDGYKAGKENDGKQFEKEVFTYGVIDIKEKTSILVCIDTKDYEEKKLDKAFPVLFENIISFEILENCMDYV